MKTRYVVAWLMLFDVSVSLSRGQIVFSIGKFKMNNFCKFDHEHVK